MALSAADIEIDEIKLGPPVSPAMVYNASFPTEEEKRA